MRNTPIDDRARKAIRMQLDVYGLRVECETCGRKDRHWSHQGRLRERRCQSCGSKLVSSAARARRLGLAE